MSRDEVTYDSGWVEFDPPKPARRGRKKTDADPEPPLGGDDFIGEVQQIGENTHIVDEFSPALTPDEVLTTPAEKITEAGDHDVGNWKFTPWRKLPMWTHVRTHETLFDRQKVWKRRKQ